MRKLAGILTAAAIGAAAFAGAYMLPAGRALLADSPAVAAASSGQSAVLYIMRTWQGKIGIFRSGSSTAERVLDVYVETLPREEQEKLAAGIPIYSERQLASLIDDYSG